MTTVKFYCKDTNAERGLNQNIITNEGILKLLAIGFTILIRLDGLALLHLNILVVGLNFHTKYKFLNI